MLTETTMEGMQTTLAAIIVTTGFGHRHVRLPTMAALVVLEMLSRKPKDIVMDIQ